MEEKKDFGDFVQAEEQFICSETVYPVGSQSVRLPVLLDSFKPALPVGTARYNTMKSVYRGKDEERKRQVSLQRTTELKPDNKEMAEMKFPEIVMDKTPAIPANKRLPDLSPRYITIFKNKLKMKGFDYFEIHQRNRQQKESPKRTVLQNFQFSKKHKRKSKSLNDLSKIQHKKEVELNASVALRDRIEQDSAYDSTIVDENEESEMEKRIREMVEGYSETPGQKKKLPKTGRRLGNIVSSHRLNQLLSSDSPLRMENFYNYYPR